MLLFNKIFNDIKVGKYERKHETHHTHSKYIAEYWNTLSNLPFIIIGFLRIIELTHYRVHDNDIININITSHMINLYFLCICAGICSGFHHMLVYKWTIIVDWIPIATSIIYILYNINLVYFISLISWFKILLAIFVLFTDHICTNIQIPWGHVFWHILSSFAIDSAYQDIVHSN